MADADARETAHEFTVIRVIAAPVAAVWDAWEDPDQIKDWWGPAGFAGAVHRMDFREGGTTLVSMSAPQFGEFHHTWTYTRIEPHLRIEFESRFADSEGHPIPPIAPGVPDVVPHVVSFRNLGNGQTELSVTETGYSSPEPLAMSKAGQEQVLDKLAAAVVRMSADTQPRI